MVLKGQAMGAMIAVMITVMLGVVLIAPVEDNVLKMTSLSEVDNETHTPAAATAQNYSFLVDNPGQGLGAIQFIWNDTATFSQVDSCADYDGSGTNYTVNLATGNVTVCNYASVTPVDISYTWKASDYLGGASASVVNNIPLLLGVGILLFAVALFGRKFI